jgi:hypothetical protein
LLQPHFELIDFKDQVVDEAKFPQEFTDATHALVGLSLVQVEDGYADWV